MKTLWASRVLFLIHTTTACWASASPDDDKLASANTGFAFKLLTVIAKEQPEKNIFISPYSVSTVLQMVENGAGGTTKAELRQALGITGLSQTAQNEANRDLSQVINASTTNLILNTANAIWYRTGISVKPAFIACNQDFYQATVEALNFNDPATVGRINSWVNEKTHGKIPSMVSSPIDPLTYLYLANAVYFKGDWAQPFRVKDTANWEFHLWDGQTKKLPMMLQGGEFSYCTATNYQAVCLPYQGSKLKMYVFLPDVNSSPEELLAKMNGDDWQQVTVPGFKDRKGTLGLPRFKFECGVDLKPSLRALGIQSAFSFKLASFSAICRGPMFISEVKQKTFIEVNEKGAEAAATTMFFMSYGEDVNSPKPFRMIVDRPFLFLIEDRESKTILFMGIIFDPSLAG